MPEGNAMKRLCIKILILFSIVFLLFFLVNLRYLKTNHWKYQNDVHKFSSIPYDIELANLGSSHGNWGFYYNYTPEINAFNFGLGSQKFFYDFSMLQQFIGHFKKDAVLLVPISYFAMIHYTEDQELKSFNVVRPRYYRILDRKYLDSWSFIDYLQYRVFGILSSGIHVLDVIKDTGPSEDPYFTRTGSMGDKELYDYCENYRKIYADVEKTDSMNIESVSKIVDFAVEHNLRPVFISTPILDYLNDIFAQDEEFFPTFYRFIDNLIKKYPNVPYLDYSHDERIVTHREFFSDADHLNMFGAEIFTKLVVSDLRKIGMLPEKE